MTKKDILNRIALDRFGKPYAELDKSLDIIQTLDEALTNQHARAEIIASKANEMINLLGPILEEIERGAISSTQALQAIVTP